MNHKKLTPFFVICFVQIHHLGYSGDTTFIEKLEQNFDYRLRALQRFIPATFLGGNPV